MLCMRVDAGRLEFLGSVEIHQSGQIDICPGYLLKYSDIFSIQKVSVRAVIGFVAQVLRLNYTINFIS